MAAIDDILGGPAAEPRQKKPTGTPQAQPTGSTDATPNNTAEQPTEGAEKPPMTYVEMFQMLNPERPETAEEKAKRQKREKAEAALAAVGDGISALSNLWFTSQYAPNAYDPSKGMSAATKDRWDKLRQEREANRRAYSDGYMRAMAMDEAKEKDERNWRHTVEREKIADERYEVKAAQDKALADLNEQLKRHQITAAEYKAEQERIAAQFAEGTEQLKQDNLRAGIQQKKAAAGASYASANASNAKAEHYRNGDGNGKGPKLQLEDDDPMRFNNTTDYDRTVMRLAKEYGVPTTVEVPTGSVIQVGPKRGTPIMKQANRDVKDIAADIEREAAKRKKQKSSNNTMPGVGGNGGGSSTTMPGVK